MIENTLYPSKISVPGQIPRINFVYQKTSIYNIYPRIMIKVNVSATVGMSATVGGRGMSATVGGMSVTVGRMSAEVSPSRGI